MHKRYELTGQTFGMLTVIRFVEVGPDYTTRWLCRCECGTEKVAIGKNLMGGRTQSCGCKQGGRSGLHGSVIRTHGMSKHPLYTGPWLGMRRRCLNPNNPDYPNYGGRGIRICDAWNDFEVFLRDMGPTWKRGLTIERIDVNGHYEPGNCKWIPNEDQWRTRRTHGRKRKPNGPPTGTHSPQVEDR